MVTTGIYSLSVNPPAYDKTKTTGTAQCSTGQPIDFWQAQTIPYPINLVGGNMVTPTYTYNNGTTNTTTTNTTTDETADAASSGVDKNLLPQEGDTEEVKAQKAQDMAYAVEDLLKGNPSSSNVQLVDRYFSAIIATKDADYVQKFLDVAKDANININGDNVSSLFGAYTKAVSNNSMSVFDNKPAQETSESATLNWLKKFQSVSSDSDYQNAYSDFAGFKNRYSK
jgi:hypothetical protein